MKRKIFMILAVIGMFSTAISMMFAAAARQYDGAIFYLILFTINAFAYFAARSGD